MTATGHDPVRGRPAWLAVAPTVVALTVLFGGALVGALRTSLQPGPAGTLGDVTLEVWRDVLASPAFRDALVFTTRITVLATGLSALLAVAAAAALRDRGSWLRGLHGVPILVPHLVVAVVAVVWVGPGGLVERLLGELPVALVRDRAGLGIVAVYVVKEVPFLTLLLLASWDRTVGAHEEAAAVLGASAWRRFRFVVWPSLRAPLAFGSVIVAAFSFGSFEVPLVVGPTYPPTLAVLALQQTQGSVLVGQARAAAILLVAALVALAAAVVAVRELRYLRG